MEEDRVRWWKMFCGIVEFKRVSLFFCYSWSFGMCYPMHAKGVMDHVQY